MQEAALASDARDADTVQRMVGEFEVAKQGIEQVTLSRIEAAVQDANAAFQVRYYNEGGEVRHVNVWGVGKVVCG